MVEVKVKNKDCWCVLNGYLNHGKWYQATDDELDMFKVSGEHSENGMDVFILEHHVEVREVLKLEVGKKYVTKGGEVVGPMVKSESSWGEDKNGNKPKFKDENDWHYSENGYFIYADLDCDDNIVSEYVEEVIFGTRPVTVILDDIEVDDFKDTINYFLDESVSYQEEPVEEVTVKRLKAGTYGRLKLSTDGYHAINISVVDGGRTWSKDDLEQAIETLTKIKDAR